MKNLIKKNKQFFCKHEDDDINIDFSLGSSCILLLPVWGEQVNSATMTCRKCGKRLGRFRLHGKGFNGKVDNEVEDIYKIDWKGSLTARKAKSLWTISMMIRRGFVTGEQVTALLKAESKG